MYKNSLGNNAYDHAIKDKYDKRKMLRKEKILGDSMYNYTIIPAHIGWKNIQ